MGRLWQTVILKEWKEIFAWLPVETLIKEKQKQKQKKTELLHKLQMVNHSSRTR